MRFHSCHASESFSVRCWVNRSYSCNDAPPPCSYHTREESTRASGQELIGEGHTPHDLVHGCTTNAVDAEEAREEAVVAADAPSLGPLPDVFMDDVGVGSTIAVLSNMSMEFGTGLEDTLGVEPGQVEAADAGSGGDIGDAKTASKERPGDCSPGLQSFAADACMGIFAFAVLAAASAVAGLVPEWRSDALSCLVGPLGAWLRWILGRFNGRWRTHSWLPVGTLAANVLAATLDTLLQGIMVRQYRVAGSSPTGSSLGTFVQVAISGFAGSMSTVSTFAMEVRRKQSNVNFNGSSAFQSVVTCPMLANGLIILQRCIMQAYNLMSVPGRERLRSYTYMTTTIAISSVLGTLTYGPFVWVPLPQTR